MDMLAEQILTQMQQQQVRFVVVGASAGAIEVLGRLLPAFRGTTPLSVICVVHIPADRESLLVSIFENRCALKTVEPNDKQAIEPAHLYFAPPGYHLLVERQQVFSLSVDPPVHYSRPSVDMLFESAADAFGNQVAGVVLTGANRDGAEGLRTIIDHGGLAIVQDPQTAEATMMPQSAKELCPEAYMLSLAQMAELFQRL